MRTFNEILDIHIDRSIMSPAEEKAIHAAMKEAMEEYAVTYTNWINETCYMNGGTITHYKTGKSSPEQLKDLFNAHLAAEAEKERGRDDLRS